MEYAYLTNEKYAITDYHLRSGFAHFKSFNSDMFSISEICILVLCIIRVDGMTFL